MAVMQPFGYLVDRVDAIGAWIARVCGTVQAQVRLGVLATLASIPLIPLGVIVSDTAVDLLIYEMSAAALIYGGVSTIVAALPSDPREAPGL